jgi:hypothetical protein
MQKVNHNQAKSANGGCLAVALLPLPRWLLFLPSTSGSIIAEWKRIAHSEWNGSAGYF